MIEDDLQLQSLYREALASEHMTLVGATTGKEGLEKVLEDLPDLILLDIMLPGGMNGFDVAEQIKKDLKLRAIPIIVLTNLDSEQKSAEEIGANDYLVKSNTSIEQVVTKIKALVGA